MNPLACFLNIFVKSCSIFDLLPLKCSELKYNLRFYHKYSIFFYSIDVQYHLFKYARDADFVKSASRSSLQVYIEKKLQYLQIPNTNLYLKKFIDKKGFTVVFLKFIYFLKIQVNFMHQ